MHNPLRNFTILALSAGAAAALAAALPAISPAAAHAGQGAGARAVIIDRNRGEIGQALFSQAHGGVLIALTVEGLPAGPHGLHIHQRADCSAADFTSTGGHINPEGVEHGLLNVLGPDRGDLPNLIVAADGSARVELFSPYLSIDGEGGLAPLLDTDGAALIIHAEADDYVTQPIGGAGARLACGEIRAFRGH